MVNRYISISSKWSLTEKSRKSVKDFNKSASIKKYFLFIYFIIIHPGGHLVGT